ncbi:unnamed protein product [Lactuca saligna]|uniref:Uncharacterized protein n=1 Tax=Lactuca saligna TaxID=75948 RepID=A0AA35Z2P3_LACSI|nr:unnamed protein product [Lactuca saligna]
MQGVRDLCAFSYSDGTPEDVASGNEGVDHGNNTIVGDEDVVIESGGGGGAGSHLDADTCLGGEGNRDVITVVREQGCVEDIVSESAGGMSDIVRLEGDNVNVEGDVDGNGGGGDVIGASYQLHRLANHPYLFPISSSGEEDEECVESEDDDDDDEGGNEAPHNPPPMGGASSSHDAQHPPYHQQYMDQFQSIHNRLDSYHQELTNLTQSFSSFTTQYARDQERQRKHEEDFWAWTRNSDYYPPPPPPQ